MSASTAPAAKAALIALLSAHVPLAGVIVTWGGPTEEEDVREDMIFFADVVFEEDWNSLGNLRRVEEYQLGFQVRVRRYGDDEQSAEERLWALFSEMKAAIRADPTLGGTIRQFTGIQGRQTNQPLPQQWAAAILGSITCEAQL